MSNKPVIEFDNVRIFAAPIFTPEHINPKGTKTPARATVFVATVDPGKGVNETLTLAFFGKQAIDVCKWGAPGKALSFVKAYYSTYKTAALDERGNSVLSESGNVVMTKRTHFQVISYTWGEDSKKQINYEITEGHRPLGWDDKLPLPNLLDVLERKGPGGVAAHIRKHKYDAEVWKETMRVYANVKYEGKGTTFGHAKVMRRE